MVLSKPVIDHILYYLSLLKFVQKNYLKSDKNNEDLYKEFYAACAHLQNIPLDSWQNNIFEIEDVSKKGFGEK
jgi:hypothetical protein